MVKQDNDKVGNIGLNDLLTLNAAVITGLLFFFALSTDLKEKSFIVLLIVFPLEIFSITTIMILSGRLGSTDQTKTLKAGIRWSITGIILLFVILAVIGLDAAFEYPISNRYQQLNFPWSFEPTKDVPSIEDNISSTTTV